MLVIRNEQMKAFEEAAIKRFQNRIFRDIKTLEQEDIEAEDDDSLRSFVEDAVGRAFEYGLTTEKNIFCFVLCALKYGKKFDTENSFFQSVFREHKGNEAILGKYIKLASN